MAADATVVRCDDLLLDESLLTGQSKTLLVWSALQGALALALTGA